MKQWMRAFLLTVAVVGTGLVAATQPADAASKYTIVKQHWYVGNKGHIVQPKTRHQSAWLWNMSHTKVKSHFNLKDYPNRTFNVRAAVQYKTATGRKTGIYYYVSSIDYGKAISGMVSRNYVKKGVNPYSGDVMLDAFSTDTEYTNYLKHSPYTKLAKNTLKLFPNTPVSLELSKIARAKYGAYEQSKYLTGRSDTEVDTSAYKSIDDFKNLAADLLANNAKSDTTKLSLINKDLVKAGYTSSKLNSLSSQQLGIDFTNNTKFGQSHARLASGYALILGQK